MFACGLTVDLFLGMPGVSHARAPSSALPIWLFASVPVWFDLTCLTFRDFCLALSFVVRAFPPNS